jgi:hypothetical protein
MFCVAYGACGTCVVFYSAGAFNNPFLAYHGCFYNKDEHRISGHIRDKTIEECASLAEDMGSLYFGMENPQGFNREYAAQCLLLPSIPESAPKVSDNECAVEMDGDSHRLGGSYRLAVYEGECLNCWFRLVIIITKLYMLGTLIPDKDIDSWDVSSVTTMAESKCHILAHVLLHRSPEGLRVQRSCATATATVPVPSCRAVVFTCLAHSLTQTRLKMF